MVVARTLPDLDQLDAGALKALLRATHEQLISHQDEIESLKLLIAKLRRMQFGRKSEKLQQQIEQLELKLEELETAKAQRNVSVASVSQSQSAVWQKPTRQALPEHLPREVRTYQPKQDACPECGGHLRKLGEDVSEVLEYVPARFRVIRHVRPKFSCASCEHIVQEPAPIRPIERGLAAPGLLAHVLVAKYCDHQPLYRLSEMYAREGVELERSTLADWVGGASRLLHPLVDAISRHVLATAKLHADDVPVPVLAPGNGKTKIGRLWTYVRDDRPAGETTPPAVWFAYSPDRRGEHPRQHLHDFRGFLQADGTRDSIIFMTEDRFRRPPVGHTYVASSTSYTLRMPRPSQPRPSSASRLCMRLKARFEVDLRRNDSRHAARVRDRCSNRYTRGWSRRSIKFPENRSSRRQFVTRSLAGAHCCVTARTGTWR